MGAERHPIIHVASEDADAYAAWIGKGLPTEAEWEFAARGGLTGATFVWGEEFAPRGKMLANTWQGEFPWQNLGIDGYGGTSPVKSFPPNGYGLFDMAGNVWEWTSDYFTAFAATEHACCVPRNPRATSSVASLIPSEPGAHIPRKVIKGGLAPLRAERLPALSTRGAAERNGGHLDEPYRVPVHRPVTPAEPEGVT